jgi:PKD repeat protein
MEEINPRCECRIDLILGEAVTSTCGTTTYEMTLIITEYEGKEYYAILGFENGGAGVNFEPKAKILAPSEGYVGQEILFDGSQSFDPNDDPLVFVWDFGDGVTSADKKPTHIYQTPGEYLVTLTVDDGMTSSTATTTIKILSPPAPPPTGFVYFGAEKKISEKVEDKKIEIPPKETVQEIKKPEKITKILKIEKPKEKEEKTTEGKISEGQKEIKTEIQIPPQNFLPFLLASLKEMITTPSIIIPAILSFFALLFILIKEIKMLKRK